MSAKAGRSGRLSADAALWASAFVLGALLIVQAGRGADSAARAEMASSVGGYTLMTTQTQSGEILYIIDNLSEQFFVYNVEQQRELVLLHKEDLKGLFTSAKNASR
jgi:hypothetical protein